MHALFSGPIQFLQMETCACLINYQECPLPISPQNLSAEKHAIKKPQGMLAVCSLCPTSVPTLRFQGKSQTICADLFELESLHRDRVISKGRGCVKMGRKGGGKIAFCGEMVFKLQRNGAVLHSYSYSSLTQWNLDMNKHKHIQTLLQRATENTLCCMILGAKLLLDL